MTGIAVEDLASELAAQGLSVFIPKFGLRNLTAFRKRAWELFCLAFKNPKHKDYIGLTRRDRKDPTRPVKSMDPEEQVSRQIHAPRREAIQLKVLTWLSTVVSLTTWQVTVRVNEFRRDVSLGVRRIPRALEEIEKRGYITIKKSADSWTITAHMALWASIGMEARARGVQQSMEAKARSKQIEAKAKECRAREAEEKQERKEERREETKKEAELERYLYTLAACFGDLPQSVVRQIRALDEQGTKLSYPIIEKLVEHARRHSPAPPHPP